MQGGTVVVSALFQECRRRGEAAIRRAAVAGLREIIGRALSAPQYPLFGYNPTERIPPQMPGPSAPPPPQKAAARRLAIEDVQRVLPPPPTPQRRGREQEMLEAQAPEAKQRVITEQEILTEPSRRRYHPHFYRQPNHI